MGISRKFNLIRSIVAIAIALSLTFIIIFLVSEEPTVALKYFLLGPVMKFNRFANVIEMMLPILFTGLAVSLIGRTGLINLASEGAFFIGGSVAALFAIVLDLPGFLLPLVCIILGGIAGMLCMLIPTSIKLKFGSSEIVASLMLNYVMFYFGSFLIRAFVRNPDSGKLQSLRFPAHAMLTKIMPPTRIHSGLIIALAFVLILWVYLYKSRWGYRMRMVGSNQGFSKYSGIDVAKSIIIGQALAGLVSGIGGASEMLGMYRAFTWNVQPGYGWDGIIVATLARNNPALVPFGAFFLAYMRVGADIMTRMSDVQNEIVAIIQGVVIVLLVAESFLSGWEKRAVFREATAESEKGGCVEA